MSDPVADLEAQAEALLASDRVTAPTRRALAERLACLGEGQGVLSPRQSEILVDVAARLVPLGDLQARVQLAHQFDVELARGRGKGWRHAEMPDDAQAVGQGLSLLDEASGTPGFTCLQPADQDALLMQVRSGALPAWPFSSVRWFEEVLAALVRLTYAHPLVQLDIGYDGMADAHGFQDIDAPVR